MTITTRVEKTLGDVNARVQIQRYLPQGWDEAPTTAVKVLQCARDLLVEEGQDVQEFNDEQKARGRWGIGHWFQNSHPELDPEDPFCNSWSVCAMGAVGVVTCGVYRQQETSHYIGGGFAWGEWTFGDDYANYDPADDDVSDWYGLYDADQRRLYIEANDFLTQAAQELWPVVKDDEGFESTAYWESPAEANDHEYVCRTRTETVGWFNKAIELASVDA